MSASSEALVSTLGESHPAIEAISAANSLVRIAMEEQLVGQPVDPTNPFLHDFLRAQLLRSGYEHLYLVFVDHKGIYLRGELASQGGRNGLKVSIRHLVHRALDTDAAAVLLAHNHPSGDCRPSACDIAETKRLVTIFKAIDLSLIDHLVICNRGAFSIKKGKEL